MPISAQLDETGVAIDVVKEEGETLKDGEEAMLLNTGDVFGRRSIETGEAER